MKIGIVGQGASGVMLALMLKKELPTLDITIFDHNEKPNKKLLATGNGRCNLGNLDYNDNVYNNDFAKKLYKSFPIKKQLEFYESIGLETRNLNNLVYPFSLKAAQVVDYFNKLMKMNRVKLINGYDLLDYEVTEKDVRLRLHNGKFYKFDYVVFACGGKSKEALGSDGCIFQILPRHGYKINDLVPGLTPIRVKENVRGIENERIKGVVSVYIDKNKIYEEEGEILVKKDGLSGIAIMNASSMIKRSKQGKKTRIVIDMFKDQTEDELFLKFKKYGGLADFSFLEGIFSIKMAEFIRKNSGCKNLYNFDFRDYKNLAHYVKNMEFTYVENYDFEDSQVTLGGVSISNLNDDLSSKVENRIYMMGEMIDVDGLCGGYNLMLCFAAANKIKDSLLSKI